jgi:truncated hemoglobin YjbI
MPFDDNRFDKRVLQRNLLSGKITQEEYDRYMKRLKDASKEADTFEATLIPIKRKIPTHIMDEDDEL